MGDVATNFQFSQLRCYEAITSLADTTSWLRTRGGIYLVPRNDKAQLGASIIRVHSLFSEAGDQWSLFEGVHQAAYYFINNVSFYLRGP
jgi:hypothetical protein